MAKPDNGSKITNFEDVLSKAKNVSEVLNKKGSAYLELSRKRIEYMDANQSWQRRMKNSASFSIRLI